MESLKGVAGLGDPLQHGLVDSDRWVEAVDGARAAVEPVGDRIELLLAVDRQVRTLGQVLAQQAVDILATAPLPRTARVAEVDPDAGGLRQLGVARHFLAAVVGEGLSHRLGNAAQLGGEALQGRGCGGVLELGQQHQTRAALHQHAHRRAVGRPLEEVAFPVPGEGPLVGLGRTQVDAHSVGQLTTPVLATRARHALGLRTPQTGDEFLAQLAARHRVDAVVDGLVRDAAIQIVGPHALECAGNLGRRPALQQEVVHHAEEHAVFGQLGVASALEAHRASTRAGCPRIVGAAAAACRHEGRALRPLQRSPDLARDRRRRASQRAGNAACRAALLQQDHDGGALLGAQVLVVRSHEKVAGSSARQIRDVALDY